MEVTCVRKLLIFGLVATLLIGAVYAMPMWMYGYMQKGDEEMYKEMHHGYGFGGMMYMPMMYMMQWMPCMAFFMPQYFDEYKKDEKKEEEKTLDEIVEEILATADVIDGYIVKDGKVYGKLFKDIKLEDLTTGEPIITKDYVVVPLLYNGTVVGFISLDNTVGKD